MASKEINEKGLVKRFGQGTNLVRLDKKLSGVVVLAVKDSSGNCTEIRDGDEIQISEPYTSAVNHEQKTWPQRYIVKYSQP